jgi:hypothetical protein
MEKVGREEKTAFVNCNLPVCERKEDVAINFCSHLETGHKKILPLLD